MFCKNCGMDLAGATNFCKNCGEKVVLPGKGPAAQSGFLWWLKNHKGLLLGILTAVVVFAVLRAIGSSWQGSDYREQVYSGDQISLPLALQREISRSVVNIYCPSTLEWEDGSGGSGTIMTEDGIILTNSHIIPQDETNVHVDDEGCMVILPDPLTGQPADIYLAKPIVLLGLSDEYDLAYMQINAAYYDEEEGEYAGVYPRKFPAFDPDNCPEKEVELGEPVRIFGYPEISGGYSLTITDGLVSSFPGDGMIITSAKISYGNSGGLAVDRNGCFIGIPSMVSSDEAETLGVIISKALIEEFSEEFVESVDNLE